MEMKCKHTETLCVRRGSIWNNQNLASMETLKFRKSWK